MSLLTKLWMRAIQILLMKILFLNLILVSRPQNLGAGKETKRCQEEEEQENQTKKVFFRMLELCIINAMVLYFCANPDLAKKWQAHKLFRIQLVHELVQPLLNCIADGEGDIHSPGVGRKTSLDELRLKGNIFLRAYTQNVGGVQFAVTRKGPMRNIKTQKHPIIVGNVKNLYVKDVLSHFTQEVNVSTVFHGWANIRVI